MGSSQSAPRKLTIDNEEGNVVQLSETLVERLTQKIKEKEDTPDKVRPTTPTPYSFSEGESIRGHQNDAQMNSEYYVLHPQVTVTVNKIQRQKEEELRNQDLYWQKRLDNLEQKHARINKIIDHEYSKAMKEMQESGPKKVNVRDVVEPCKNNFNTVAKCYQDNPKQTLNCSNIVEEFCACVDQRHSQLIAAR